MTFAHPWILAFAAIPAAWAAWESRTTARRTPLILKACSLLAVILALAEPRLSYNDTKVAVAVLVDTSSSISPQDLTTASQLATQIEAAKGRNIIQVIPF